MTHRNLCVLVVLSLSIITLSAQDSPITLHVDAREAPRRIFHVQMQIPALPGALTLYYPKWLPGNHRPTGPIVNLVNFHMSAAGQLVPWQRDDVDMYAFHCQLPAGANSLEVSFDYVSPSHGPGRFDPVSTDQVAILNWNVVLLYPKGKSAADYTYRTTLRLPQGWKFGTALPVERETADAVEFSPVPLTMLVDSPLLAGAHYRAIPLPSPGAPPQEIDLAADSAAAIDLPQDLIDHYKQLTAEAGVLFGAHHYRDYHFLVTLSDVENGSGLEHHESSDNRIPERTLIEANGRELIASLLPHEFTHSWNGKYRRPAGLLTSDYQQPMKGNLLWVYEGLTNYLGEVLAARSGLATPEQARESLALTAAGMKMQAGRNWRSLEDTAVSVQMLMEAPGEWNALRRSADYYPEGVLLWLEADTIIRNETHGQRSLDDFCKSFFGLPSGAPTVKTYELPDVVAALNQTANYDWAAFFKDRVSSVAPQAPLKGIEQSGWQLVFTDTLNDLSRASEEEDHSLDLRTSLGLMLHLADDKKDAATISDVIPGTPAADAGLAPGMKLLAVDGRRFSRAILHDALKTHKAFQVLAENIGYYKTYSLNYSGGLRSPHLVRNGSDTDLLSEIMKPHADSRRQIKVHLSFPIEVSRTSARSRHS